MANVFRLAQADKGEKNEQPQFIGKYIGYFHGDSDGFCFVLLDVYFNLVIFIIKRST